MNNNRVALSGIKGQVSADPMPGSLQFTQTQFSGPESGGLITFTVSRVRDSTLESGGGAVSVDYALTAGTATAGSDFTATSGTLFWSDGDFATKSFGVTITPDSIAEGMETFTATLSNPAGAPGVFLGYPTSAVGVIQEIWPPNGQVPAGWTTPVAPPQPSNWPSGAPTWQTSPWAVATDFAGDTDGTSLKSGALPYACPPNCASATPVPPPSATEFVGNFDSGLVVFSYKVSSYPNQGFFEFFVDGVKVLSDSGDSGWKNFSTPISSGSHTLQWRYRATLYFPCSLASPPPPQGNANCFDRAWIDAVSLPIPPAPPPGAPSITSASFATLAVATAGSFTVTATGTPTPTLSVSGALPTGVTFNPANGVLGGTPALGTVGTYPLVFTAANGLLPDASQNFALSIGTASQTITFNALPGKTIVDPPFTVSATASSGLPVAFASSTTGVCTVSGSTVTILALGTCTLNANQAGDTNYNTAPQVSQSFTVSKASQVITFSGLAGRTIGDPPFTVSATASSGLAVTFSSSTPGICTAAGTTVTIVAAGLCTVNANQAGDATYNPAPQVSQSFTVAKASQTITFGALGGKTIGDPPFTVSATASSGLTVTFSSLTTSTCTVSGTTVTLVATGICTIAANQPGDANYLAAPQETRSFEIASPGNYALSVTKTGTGTGTVTSNPAGIDCGSTCSSDFTGTTVVTLTAVAAGQSAFSGWSGACTGTGTCQVTMDQTITVTATFTSIAKLDQTISFAALGVKTFGDAPFPVTATATSGLAVTFTTATTGVCSVSGSTVSIVAVGTCTIDANQAGNATYNPAPQVSQTFTVAKANQTITFNALGGKTYGDAPFTVTATATSGLTVALTSVTAAVCTVSGNTVTLVAAGTCTVAANQVGNGNYNPAPQVLQSFTVAKLNQTITFNALTGKTYGDAPFTVTATATSGFAVTFSSATPGVCTIPVSSSTVTIVGVGAGTCTVNANQAGNGNYNAATMVPQSFTVAKANQTISFGALTGKTYGDAPFSVTATATSGLPVTFTAATTDVCTVSSSTVIISTAGTCTITANQAGNANYNVATPVSQSFTVAKANQTISFSTITGKSYGDAPFSATATATSGLAVQFTSVTTGVCTVTLSGTVTIVAVGTGTCTLNANQLGNINYNAAPQASQSFTVAKASQTITFNALTNKRIDDAPFPVSATASSGLAVVFSSLTSSICTVSGSTVTLVAVGTCTIAANQPGDANYLAAAQVTRSFDIGPLSTFALTVTKAGSGAGTVTSNVGGINCGSTCSVNITQATAVTLTATPAAESLFTGWSGEGCSGTGTCVVTMDQVRAVTATFAPVTYSLSVAKSGSGTGTVTSNGNVINCGATCASDFNSGTVVTLTAAPNSGSTFTGWSGAGCSGTGTCVVTMNAAKAVTATFALITHTLTVIKTGSGTGTVTSDVPGINCGATCSFSFNVGTVVTLTAVPTAGSVFTGWSGACVGTGTCQVTMSSANTATATFAPDVRTLIVTRTGTGTGTVTSNVAGINCGATCSSNYVVGTVVTLTAVAAGNSVFAGWSGACTGTGTCQVTMNAAATATATFTVVTHALTVTKVGSGTGTVTSNVTGIDCGATCSSNFVVGTLVTLTALAANDSVFSGWSGACTGTGACQVTMNAAANVTATFTLATYALTVTKAGSGAGTVTSNVGGIDCGATCAFNFNSGTVVTLTAAAAGGSTFAGWSGACTGTGGCTVTIDSAKAVTATFDANPSARLANISTRMQVLTGNDVMIGGFVIGGSANKTVARRSPWCALPTSR